MKTLRLLIACIALALTTPSAYAQDQEDFARLAKRHITAYIDSAKHTADYASRLWHGGIYVGNSNQGRLMPNTFVNYKHGKWALNSTLNFDVATLYKYRDEKSLTGNTELNITNERKNTATDIRNHYEHQDLTFRADYSATKRDVISFDLFEKYHHDRVDETTLQTGRDQTNTPLPSKHEQQGRKVKDFNFGTMIEHKHSFAHGGSIEENLYFKYDNKPTDVTSTTWGENLPSATGREHQRYTSADPKAQIIYLSPRWGGFSFGVRQKVGLMNMSIEDTASDFDYDVRQSLSSAGINYQSKLLTLNAGAGYELYHHDIDDHDNPTTHHTYRDWKYNAVATCKWSARHLFSISFNHSINRPTYTQLYPWVHIGSGIASYVIGNPQLQPSSINQVQAKYTLTTKPLTVSAIMSYRMTDDDITRISIYHEPTDRWVKTWVNDAQYRTLRAALEGEVRQGIFSMTWGIHAQHLKYSGQNVKTDHAWSCSYKMRPQFDLSHEWQLACVVIHYGRETHQHEYQRSHTYLALRATKRIGPWGIYGYVQDILRPDRVNVLKSDQSKIITSNDDNARGIVLGASYTF